MAKLVAGVKTVKSVSFVSVPVSVTQYQTSNGRTYPTPAKANIAQQHINFREASKRLSEFLSGSGLTPANNPYTVTTHQLAKALSDPKFVKRLTAIAA